MLKPGTIVRIKTLEELEHDNRVIHNKDAILKWQNKLCEIVFFKAVGMIGAGNTQVSYQYKLSLLDCQSSKKEDRINGYSIGSFLWSDYEIEQYNIPDIQEDAYMCLIKCNNE